MMIGKSFHDNFFMNQTWSEVYYCVIKNFYFYAESEFGGLMCLKVTSDFDENIIYIKYLNIAGNPECNYLSNEL